MLIWSSKDYERDLVASLKHNAKKSLNLHDEELFECYEKMERIGYSLVNQCGYDWDEVEAIEIAAIKAA